MQKAAIGIDLGGTNLRFGLVREDEKIVSRRRTGTMAAEGVEIVLERLTSGIHTLARKAESDGLEIAGIGIGVPGIISAREGVVRISPNLPGWKDIPLRSHLKESFPYPVYVENDANAYALGEYWFGAGKGAKSMVCITLGTGVGGGIILNGDIWRGADGMAGEVGHITVNPDGPLCPCGNRGCLERYSSATAVMEMAVAAVAGSQKTALKSLAKKGLLTPEAIANVAKKGDRTAMRIYSEAGKYLGIAVADLINLLNIECIVIGGGLSGAWELFIGPLKEEVRARAFKIPAERCGIIRGRLKDDAGILGAVGLALKTTR
ncbi:MAG: ROK family protein [Nitrospirota bacterium]